MIEDFGDSPSVEERIPAYHLDPAERATVNEELYGQEQLEIIQQVDNALGCLAEQLEQLNEPLLYSDKGKGDCQCDLCQ